MDTTNIKSRGKLFQEMQDKYQDMRNDAKQDEKTKMFPSSNAMND